MYDQLPEQESKTVLSQYACAVGQWIYGHALIEYENIPEVLELEQVHASMHVLARELVNRYQQGQVEEARQGLVGIEQIADRLVELLHIVEKKVITESPNAVASNEHSKDSILSALLAENELLDTKIQQQLATQQQHAILENERQVLHDFFMQAPAAHCILRGPAHIFELTNPPYQELVGGRHVLGKTVREALPELEGQGFYELLDAVFSTGEPFVGKELPIFLDNGRGQTKNAYLNFIYQPIKNRKGQVEGILVFAYEVTEQVLARQLIQESQERFRLLIEESPVATALLVGRDMRIEMANETMLSYWGRDRSVIGKLHAEALPELEGQPFAQLLDEVFTTGKVYTQKAARTNLLINDTLSTYYFDFTYKPLRQLDGHVYAILATAVDVTEQTTIQQKLAASESRFRSIVEQAPMAIGLFKGRNMVIELGNEPIFRVWGKDPSIVGLPLLEALPEIRDQGFLELLQSVYDTGEPFRGNGILAKLMRNGQPVDVYFDFSYTPLYDELGVISNVMVLATDVTIQVLARQAIEESEERYRILSAELEQQVQERTEELEATNEELAASNEELTESNHLLVRSNDNLEKFAYIASHDLQEPLRKIQQFGDLLKSRYAPTSEGDMDYLARMQSAASRMSTLIRDLLDFSRIATRRDTSAAISLNTVVAKALQDLDLRIAETGAVVEVGELPTISGDPTQLGQLFQNLLANALKFHRPDERPHIQIQAQLVKEANLPARFISLRQAKQYYRIDVIDNGIGFDEKYLDRIFQVFQRLHGKNEFAGTGIGLAICEKVVLNHGGIITAKSQPGQGATFQIYLPVILS